MSSLKKSKRNFAISWKNFKALSFFFTPEYIMIQKDSSFIHESEF